MSAHKRSYAEFASGSEPTLTILTADGGRVPAHNEVSNPSSAQAILLEYF